MLKITLRDGEKVAVNGAVLRASGRTEIILENTASVLRGRDIIAPEDVDTPAKRLYFACMMAYLEPERLGEYQDLIISFLGDLFGALETREAKALCVSFSQHVGQMDYYRALGDCRKLIEYEEKALAGVMSRTAA